MRLRFVNSSSTVNHMSSVFIYKEKTHSTSISHERYANFAPKHGDELQTCYHGHETEETGHISCVDSASSLGMLCVEGPQFVCPAQDAL